MAVLIGNDGKSYDIPDANAQAAIASGQFAAPTAPAATPAAAPASVPTGASPGVVTLPEETVEAKTSPLLTLNNLQTGEEEQVPEEEATAKVAAGTHSVEDVPLVGQDGKLYQIPNDNIQAALKSGQFKISTLDERNAALRREDIERSGGTGLKPVIGETADALLTGINQHNPVAGVANALINKFDPATGKRIEESANAVSEESPVAYGAGAVGGEVASALGLGALAKGVSAATGVAGLAGTGGAIARAGLEGAVFSAEPVAKAIINKDPAGAAEALALGVGLNIGLHGVFSAAEKVPGIIGEGLQRAKTAVQERFLPELTQEESENLIGKKVLGLTPAKIAATREEIAPALKAAGVTSDDIASGKALEKIQKLEESGPAIGKAVKELDTFEGKAQVIDEHLSQAAEDLRKLAPEGIFEAPIKDLSPSELQVRKALEPLIAETLAAAERGTFADTQALKKFIGGQTNFAGDNGFVNQIRKRAYGVVAENVMRAEDAAALQLGSPEVVQGLREQRAAYTFHKLYGDAADRLAARQVPEDLTHLLGGHGTGSKHMLPVMMLHLFGAPGAVTAVAGTVGAPLLRGYVEKQGLKRAAAKLLGESTAPATNTVVHALQTQDTKIAESVKGFLSGLSERQTAKKLDTSAGLRGVVEDANGRSHEQQLRSLQRTVQEAAVTPEKHAEHVGQLVAPLRAEGLDQVADAYTEHQLRLMKVLQTILPKDPTLKEAHPFAARVQANEISPATKEKYQRALTVANDPTALLHLVKNNQITAGDVAIAAAVNPSTLQKLRLAVQEESIKDKPDLSYQQRLSMGILMGQHLDESTSQVPAIQAAYAAHAASLPAGGHAKSGKLGAGAQTNLANNSLTLSQQSSGHKR